VALVFVFLACIEAAQLRGEIPDTNTLEVGVEVGVDAFWLAYYEKVKTLTEKLQDAEKEEETEISVKYTGADGAEHTKTATLKKYDVIEHDPRLLSVRQAFKALVLGYPDSVPATFTVHLHNKAGATNTVAYAYKTAEGGPFCAAVFLGPNADQYILPFPAVGAEEDTDKMPRGRFGAPVRTVGDQVYDAFKGASKSGVREGAMADTKVMHEFCHILHEVQDGAAFQANIPRLDGQDALPAAKTAERAKKFIAFNKVSFYAGLKETGWRNEFVAEYCAGLIAGMPHLDDEDVTELYTAAGGPAVTADMKLIAKLLKGASIAAGDWPPLGNGA